MEARRESSVLDRNDSRMNIRQNFEQEFEIIPFAEQEVSANPHLKQESTYGGYYVPEKPWSTTEQYLRFNSFLTGAKLEETYGNSDECVNNIVVAID